MSTDSHDKKQVDEVTNEIERLIFVFGDNHRDMITSSISWLRDSEPNWKLDQSIDGKGFIEELLRNVSKD